VALPGFGGKYGGYRRSGDGSPPADVSGVQWQSPGEGMGMAPIARHAYMYIICRSETSLPSSRC